MAKETKKLENISENGVEYDKDTTKVKPIKTDISPSISFDAWFSSTGKPAHHKNGMKSFTNTSGTRSKDQWNSIFSKY